MNTVTARQDGEMVNFDLGAAGMQVPMPVAAELRAKLHAELRGEPDSLKLVDEFGGAVSMALDDEALGDLEVEWTWFHVRVSDLLELLDALNALHDEAPTVWDEALAAICKN